MSKFGKVLGVTLTVVFVSKAGLSVVYHTNENNAVHSQETVKRIDNTSTQEQTISRKVNHKNTDTAIISLNYTLTANSSENG